MTNEATVGPSSVVSGPLLVARCGRRESVTSEPKPVGAVCVVGEAKANGSMIFAKRSHCGRSLVGSPRFSKVLEHGIDRRNEATVGPWSVVRCWCARCGRRESVTNEATVGPWSVVRGPLLARSLRTEGKRDERSHRWSVVRGPWSVVGGSLRTEGKRDERTQTGGCRVRALREAKANGSMIFAKRSHCGQSLVASPRYSMLLEHGIDRRNEAKHVESRIACARTKTPPRAIAKPEAP